MKKVLTTTEFVLWLTNDKEVAIKVIDGSMDAYFQIAKYAHLMKQPLELGMFVPCADNRPFEQPIRKINPPDLKDNKRLADIYDRALSLYRNATEAVLFEDWKLQEQGGIWQCIVPSDTKDGSPGSVLFEGLKDKGIDFRGFTIEYVAKLGIKPTQAFLDKIGL